MIGQRADPGSDPRGPPDEISEAIAEGEFFQMQTFTKALIDLVLEKKVDSEIAANASSNRHDFLVALERAVKQRAVEVSNNTEEGDDRPAPLRPPVAPAPAPQPIRSAPTPAEEPVGLRVKPAVGQ